MLTAWPVQSEQAHALVTLDVAPALEVPGVVRVLTADDVPGLNDAGVKHDEPLFPSEAMYHGHALVWVLGEDRRTPPGSVPRRCASSTSRSRRSSPCQEAIERGLVPGHRRARSVAATPKPRSRRRRTSSRASARSADRSTSTSRRTRRSRASTPRGRSSSSRARSIPSETQEIVAHVLGLPSNRVTVQCAAHGRRLRRQGDAAARVRRRSPRSARCSRAARCGCGSTARRTSR